MTNFKEIKDKTTLERWYTETEAKIAKWEKIQRTAENNKFETGLNEQSSEIDDSQSDITSLWNESSPPPINMIVNYFTRAMNFYYEMLLFKIHLNNNRPADSNARQIHELIVKKSSDLFSFDLFTPLDDASASFDTVLTNIHTALQEEPNQQQLAIWVDFSMTCANPLEKIAQYINLPIPDEKNELKKIADWYKQPAQYVIQQANTFNPDLLESVESALLNVYTENKDALQKALDTTRKIATFFQVQSNYYISKNLISTLQDEIQKPSSILRIRTGSVFENEEHKKLHAAINPHTLLKAFLTQKNSSLFKLNQQNQLLVRVTFFKNDNEMNALFLSAFKINDNSSDPWEIITFELMNPTALLQLADRDSENESIWLGLATVAPLTNEFSFNQRVTVYHDIYSKYPKSTPELRQDIITLIFHDGAAYYYNDTNTHEQHLAYLQVAAIPENEAALTESESSHAKILYYKLVAQYIEIKRQQESKMWADKLDQKQMYFQQESVKYTTLREIHANNLQRYEQLKALSLKRYQELSERYQETMKQFEKKESDFADLEEKFEEIQQKNTELLREIEEKDITITQQQGWLETWRKQAENTLNENELITRYHNLEGQYKQLELLFDAKAATLQSTQQELEYVRSQHRDNTNINEGTEIDVIYTPSSVQDLANRTNWSNTSYNSLVYSPVTPTSTVSSIKETESFNSLLAPNNDSSRIRALEEQLLATKAELALLKALPVATPHPNDNTISLDEATAAFVNYFKDVTNSTGVNAIKEKIQKNRYHSLETFADDLVRIANERKNIVTSLWTFFGLTAGRHTKVTALYDTFTGNSASMEKFNTFIAEINQSPSIAQSM